ncbi:MAG: kinase [Kiritimatiellae bacterium]|nr:kinase [Kiritimatiellia bacterium]
MIITKTPFRISFFGGGTDYPSWYEANGGAVLSTSIDKYCWITCRELPPFFEHRSRLTYSIVEEVRGIDDIRHPSARECFRFMGISEGVEVHHDGDLPARTGLGSSSSFTVGLLRALNAFKGRMISKRQLALDAIHVEQRMIKENVGSQDQVAAAFGGLNCVTFSADATFHVEPITLPADRLAALEQRLMLFYTGLSRIASEVAAEQIKNIPDKTRELHTMRQMVDQARDILAGDDDLAGFGKLLHEAWLIKKGLSSRITTPEIDKMYEAALTAGAVGGKLTGAGGGGFVLLYVEPENQPCVRECLQKYLHVPVRFDNEGSQIVFYQP